MTIGIVICWFLLLPLARREEKRMTSKSMSPIPPEHRLIEFVMFALATAIPTAALGSIAYFAKHGVARLFGKRNKA
jgi:hypothetical protein